jgi:hypothetical protein
MIESGIAICNHGNLVLDGREAALFLASNGTHGVLVLPLSNRYGMPLLHIGGITPMNTFFSGILHFA